MADSILTNYQYSRIQNRYTNVPGKIPTIYSGDTSIYSESDLMVMGKFSDTDILNGEFFLNNADKRVFLRLDSEIHEFDMSGTTGSQYLSGLLDVTLSASTYQDILMYSAGTWFNSPIIPSILKDINDTKTTLSGLTLKHSLTDVNIGAQNNLDVLSYDLATDMWIANPAIYKDENLQGNYITIGAGDADGSYIKNSVIQHEPSWNSTIFGNAFIPTDYMTVGFGNIHSTLYSTYQDSYGLYFWDKAENNNSTGIEVANGSNSDGKTSTGIRVNPTAFSADNQTNIGISISVDTTYTGSSMLGLLVDVGQSNPSNPNKYIGQFRDHTTEGVGKVLTCIDSLGTAVWSATTQTPFINLTSFGPQIDRYFSFWVGDTVGDTGNLAPSSALSENQYATLCVGEHQSYDVHSKLEVVNQNILGPSGTEFMGIHIYNHTLSGMSTGIYSQAASSEEGQVIRIYEGQSYSDLGSQTTIGLDLNVGGAGTKYAVKLNDGSQGVGKVLTCLDSDGYARWITPSAVNPYTTISATTSSTGDVDTITSATEKLYEWSYELVNGSNSATGRIIANCNSNSNVTYTIYASEDFGDCSGISLSVSMTGGNVILTATITSGTWTYKIKRWN